MSNCPKPCSRLRWWAGTVKFPERRNTAGNSAAWRLTLVAKTNAGRFHLVDLTVEESNRLFETLQDWNDQLSHFDLDDLRCDDDDFAP